MRTAADDFADYAAGLRYEDLPGPIVAQAKICLVDAVGCALFGRDLRWSRTILAEAIAGGSSGPCRLPGIPDVALDARSAALALGAFPRV